ncbi:hypothetical protein B0H17DRAFT_1081681 [Mycena rosella]|uniref:Uncharacterized protein n=1 Tax=Mycena rosella TaxID=1033263 RepID=A0AAD7GA18_MYCRO|nr:hypothetical protein B0H17DRAFT_1081681 [Mycena rosella]
MAVERLSSMISSLSDIQSRLQQLRNAPPSLLKSSMPFSSPSIRHDFQQLKELADTIRSDSVQEALRTATNSERADKSDLNRNGRRETRKRRRPPSPDSPQPFIPYDTRSSSLFPVTSDEPPALRAHELAGYIREFNPTHSCKLHIWTRIPGSTQLGNPAVVRFTIRDVLVCYVTMAYAPSDPVLVIETEKKSPHSQSDFLVYQSLSQQIAKMLQSHPRVSFQSLMNLMCTYEGIFIDRCTSCERVLSAEGHVPPVVRIWLDAGKDSKGRWEPRHASCPQT